MSNDDEFQRLFFFMLIFVFDIFGYLFDTLHTYLQGKEKKVRNALRVCNRVQPPEGLSFAASIYGVYLCRGSLN